MPGLTSTMAVTLTVTPDNTPHGYNLTYAVPIGVFAVVAVILYLLFSRPHHRVPVRRGFLPARRAAGPEPGAARAAAIAGGLAVAAGGGSAESHLEPAGLIYAADPGAAAVAEPEPEPGDARADGGASPAADPAAEGGADPAADGPEDGR